MKTKSKIKSPFQNRAEQLSVTKSETELLPKIDVERRRANRRIKTDQLLDLLHAQCPRFWEIAEVVGQWVWGSFSEKQPRQVTVVLSQLGFHWNNKRQVWQHPCGTLIEEPFLFDPRKKYGSYFPADAKAA